MWQKTSFKELFEVPSLGSDFSWTILQYLISFTPVPLKQIFDPSEQFKLFLRKFLYTSEQFQLFLIKFLTPVHTFSSS